METVEARRAIMAVAIGDQSRGPPGLAHRVLGDGVEASRRTVRYPWRRHRSGVPASRERTRAKLLRLSRSPHGQRLDAQRLPAGRRRQDVEVRRQFCHHQGAAGRLAWRSAASQYVEDALSFADGLDVRGSGRKREDARRLVLDRWVYQSPTA